MRRSIFIIAAGLGTFLAVACSDIATFEDRALFVDIRADKETAQVGETVTFSVSADGSALQGVIIDFMDGTRDSIPAAGAVTLTATRDHAFTEAGTFDVEARVEQAGQFATDEVAVEIIGSSPGS